MQAIIWLDEKAKLNTTNVQSKQTESVAIDPKSGNIAWIKDGTVAKLFKSRNLLPGWVNVITFTPTKILR